jgi:hypothetical protein
MRTVRYLDWYDPVHPRRRNDGVPVMQSIQLNDRLYQDVQRRAAQAGFDSVDDYVADLLLQELEDAENLDHLFTPERLAHIDRAANQIASGQGLTPDQVNSELLRRREAWLRQQDNH